MGFSTGPFVAHGLTALIGRDRTQPLEKRDDLLGRLIRLMGSVYYPRLKDSVGNILFQICDGDGAFFVPSSSCNKINTTPTASTLSAQIGYGNSAGFLFNRGILAPPGSNPDGEEDSDINPITGLRNSKQRNEALDEMTEEEKEREAERLFVLFERLRATGVVDIKNPVQQAIDEGRFEELD